MPLAIRITWNKNTDDTEEYGVWRRTEGESSTEIARVPQPSDETNPLYNDEDIDTEQPTGPTELSINKPTADTVNLSWAAAADPSNPTFYYQIRAYDDAGNYSPFCPEVSLQPSNAIDHYGWELITETDGSVVDSGTIDGSATQTPDITVTEGKDYHFQIKAVDLAGNVGPTQSSEVFTG